MGRVLNYGIGWDWDSLGCFVDLGSRLEDGWRWRGGSEGEVDFWEGCGGHFGLVMGMGRIGPGYWWGGIEIIDGVLFE